MEECRRCVSRKTHYAVSLEASLQRQVHGWGSGGAATETEVRHHPTRAATTTLVTLVVTLGSLSPNSHLHEVVELPARRRKSGQPCNFEDGRWVISCIGQVTLAKLTIPRSLENRYPKRSVCYHFAKHLWRICNKLYRGKNIFRFGRRLESSLKLHATLIRWNDQSWF